MWRCRRQTLLHWPGPCRKGVDCSQREWLQSEGRDLAAALRTPDACGVGFIYDDFGAISFCQAEKVQEVRSWQPAVENVSESPCKTSLFRLFRKQEAVRFMVTGK